MDIPSVHDACRLSERGNNLTQSPAQGLTQSGRELVGHAALRLLVRVPIAAPAFGIRGGLVLDVDQPLIPAALELADGLLNVLASRAAGARVRGPGVVEHWSQHAKHERLGVGL